MVEWKTWAAAFTGVACVFNAYVSEFPYGSLFYSLRINTSLIRTPSAVRRPDVRQQCSRNDDSFGPSRAGSMDAQHLRHHVRRVPGTSRYRQRQDRSKTDPHRRLCVRVYWQHHRRISPQPCRSPCRRCVGLGHVLQSSQFLLYPRRSPSSPLPWPRINPDCLWWWPGRSFG